jgi:hypothetical protein
MRFACIVCEDLKKAKSKLRFLELLCAEIIKYIYLLNYYTFLGLRLLKNVLGLCREGATRSDFGKEDSQQLQLSLSGFVAIF